jgi:hypothetical protein
VSKQAREMEARGAALRSVHDRGQHTDRLEELEHLDVLPSPQELAKVPQLRQLRICLALLRYSLPQEARAGTAHTRSVRPGREGAGYRGRGGDAHVIDGVVGHELRPVNLGRWLPAGCKLRGRRGIGSTFRASCGSRGARSIGCGQLWSSGVDALRTPHLRALPVAPRQSPWRWRLGCAPSRGAIGAQYYQHAEGAPPCGRPAPALSRFAKELMAIQRGASARGKSRESKSGVVNGDLNLNLNF